MEAYNEMNIDVCYMRICVQDVPFQTQRKQVTYCGAEMQPETVIPV
jgi:hypothetical protein